MSAKNKILKGVLDMATTMKRFTISIPCDIESKLKQAKKETYYNSNQNEMIRDLIKRGLQQLNCEKK